ncbi:hypothetical protein R1sor_020230 [Riccia sorocarpa]|uniref:Uncharacterized protein n=1 Tax=Riccia sorocarpa TaxID=122646 RepID=A0ABD3IER0_9MARC
MTNNVENGIIKHQRADGPATVLAIGKAVPPTAYPQSEYPIFDITNTRPISKSNLLEFVKDIVIREVSRLAEKAGIQALAEWGQSREKIIAKRNRIGRAQEDYVRLDPGKSVSSLSGACFLFFNLKGTSS